MGNMIQKVYAPNEYDAAVYVTSFGQKGISPHYEAGIVHEHERLANGRVLGGMRFGGMFDIVDSPLSLAETRVLALRTVGLSVCLLADRLSVSEDTVRTQQRNLKRKLNATTMATAVTTAFSGEAPFFSPCLLGRVNSEITSSEKRIIKCLAEGSDISEIAISQSCKPTTIRTHIKHAYEKIGVAGDYYLSLVALAHLTDGVFQPEYALEMEG